MKVSTGCIRCGLRLGVAPNGIIRFGRCEGYTGPYDGEFCRCDCHEDRVSA